MIEYLQGTDKILPTKENGNVPVVLASSEAYLPYACLVLSSLLHYGSPSYFYDIFLLHMEAFSQQGRERLEKSIESWKNCRLRLIRIGYREYLPDFVAGHIGAETYARLLVPKLLQHFTDIIYLDSDLVICEDVAALLRPPVSKSTMLSGVVDLDVLGQYYGLESSMRYYINKKLRLKYPDRYLQTGVLVFHIPALREGLGETALMEAGAGCRLRYFDQDILNCLCNEYVELLDLRWNVVNDCDGYRVSRIITHAPKPLYQMYVESRQDPWIVHFSGSQKPWNDPKTDMFHYFYKAAYAADMRDLIPSEPQTIQVHPYKYITDKLLPKQSRRREWLKTLFFMGKYSKIGRYE